MSALNGVVGGLIASSQDLPTVDIQQLLATINGAGAYQKSIINQLPVEVRKNLDAYIASNKDAGTQYQSAIQALSQGMQKQAGEIYGPNSEAAGLAKDAAKKDIYSTLPGTQNAVRNALAATGGLSRGHAGSALAAPVLQAAQQYGQQAGAINADQAKMGQQAQMQALQTATSMDASMFTQLFGMTKEQAAQILQSGNASLSTQLAQLINQSNTQTNQTLGAEGVAANNGYQNAVTRNAQNNAIWTGLADMGIDGMSNLAMPGAGATSGGGMAAASPYADLGYAV